MKLLRATLVIAEQLNLCYCFQALLLILAIRVKIYVKWSMVVQFNVFQLYFQKILLGMTDLIDAVILICCVR